MAFNAKKRKFIFFSIKINDIKFHNQIINDTVHIKYRENGRWNEEYFILINDSRVKQKVN